MTNTQNQPSNEIMSASAEPIPPPITHLQLIPDQTHEQFKRDLPEATFDQHAKSQHEVLG